MYVQMLGVRSQAAAAIWAGIALGISPLVASLAAPVWGRIADRYGLKIMAVRITFALFAIWALTAFAQNVYHLLLLRFLLGLLGGFNAFSISLATQLSPQEKVGRVIGTLQAVQISSTAVGPVRGWHSRRLDRYSSHLPGDIVLMPAQPGSLHLFVSRQGRQSGAPSGCRTAATASGRTGIDDDPSRFRGCRVTALSGDHD